MNKFWGKVTKCKHKNLSDTYIESVSCWTPYCSGYEVRCNDCNVYITKCGCGFCGGMSGWSEKQWKKFNKKKEANERI